MSVPALSEHGVLPPGIHECTLEEAEQAFAHLPPQPARLNLWKSFLSYVDAIKKVGIVISVYINGGFATIRL